MKLVDAQFPPYEMGEPGLLTPSEHVGVLTQRPMGVVQALRDHTASSGGQAIPSDASLVEAARDGQSWAQAALFQRYARMAAGLAHRLLASGEADVDDLVQDAFIAALTKLPTLRAPDAFGSWLGSIVVRLSTKRLRRRALQRRLGLYRPTEFDFEPLASTDAPADVRLELRQVYGLLDQLRPEERIALILRRIDGLGVPEIAEHMGLSLSTTKRRLRAAEARLERALERAERASTDLHHHARTDTPVDPLPDSRHG